MLCTLFPLASSGAPVSNTWTGRWNGSVVVTSGPGAGRTLPCEFLISQTGTGLAGTVACPGFGPVPFSGTGTGGVEGSATGGITFSGSRQGREAGGTWTYPARGIAGTWSISRAGR